MVSPNDFDDDLDPWNGYRPPMKWYDRVILGVLGVATIGGMLGCYLFIIQIFS